jgi:His Kinase A (phospho-acceptor) domain
MTVHGVVSALRQYRDPPCGGRIGRRGRTLVVTETPLLDDERRRVGTLGIAKDVTERKELESRLIKSERLASVGELAGALAHEIRSPLGSVVAAAKMLRAESPQAADDRPALLRVITDEAPRLDRILSDFRAPVPLCSPAVRQGQQASGADGLFGHPRDDGNPASVLFAHQMNLLELRHDALFEAGVRRARGGEAAVDHPGEGFDPSPSEISLQPRRFRDGRRFRERHQ